MRCFKILVGPAEKGPTLGNLGRTLGMRKSSRRISGSTYCLKRRSKLMRLRQPHWNVCLPREAEHSKIIPMTPWSKSQMCHLEQKTWMKNNKEWFGIYLHSLLANDQTGWWTSHLSEEMTRGSSYPLALYKAPATWVPICGFRRSLKNFYSISSVPPEWKCKKKKSNWAIEK